MASCALFRLCEEKKNWVFFGSGLVCLNQPNKVVEAPTEQGREVEQGGPGVATSQRDKGKPSGAVSNDDGEAGGEKGVVVEVKVMEL